MNAALFSFVKTYDNSIIASVKIAKFLSELLDLPIYEKGTASTPCLIPEGLDVLMIINGAYGFAGKDTLENLGAAIDTAKRVIWVQQDYTILPPKDESGAESPFRKAFRNRRDRGAAPVDYWTTCEAFAKPGRAASGHICGDGSRYVNWNVLTFDASTKRLPVKDRVHLDRMIYYGAYRVLTTSNKKDREPLFRRYLWSPKVPTTISCPTDKFVVAGYVGENIIHDTQIAIPHDLTQYGLGLYLEDRASSAEFHSPANRFYEMLSAGLGMVFPPESMRMMSKAEIEVGEFALWNADEAPSKMERAQEIADRQHELWWQRAKDQRELLPERVFNLWKSYVNG